MFFGRISSAQEPEKSALFLIGSTRNEALVRFALEDIYGLKIGETDGEVCLRLGKSKGTTYLQMFDMFRARQEESAKLERGEISREEYDRWRYRCPELDKSGRWAKVPSQALSDALIEELKKE